MSCLRCYRSGCTGTRRGVILFLRIWRTGEATDREISRKIQSVSFRRLCGLRGRRRRSGSGHSEMGSPIRNGRQSVFLRQRNGNCCRNCLRHSARNCFTDCGAEKKPTANTPARGSAVQWEKISPTNRTGRKSRYVSGNGFWRIAIRWRSVTEQQKRKKKGTGKAVKG